MAIQGFNWSTRLRCSECILLLEYQLKIIMAGFAIFVLFLSFLSFCLTEVKCILLLDCTLFHPPAASLQTVKNTMESSSYDDNKAADGQNYSQLTNTVIAPRLILAGGQPHFRNLSALSLPMLYTSDHSGTSSCTNIRGDHSRIFV